MAPDTSSLKLFLSIVENRYSNPYVFDLLVDAKGFIPHGRKTLYQCITEKYNDEIRCGAVLFVGRYPSFYRHERLRGEMVAMLVDIIREKEYGCLGDMAMCVLYSLRKLMPDGDDGNLLLDEAVYSTLRQSLLVSSPTEERPTLPEIDALLRKALESAGR